MRAYIRISAYMFIFAVVAAWILSVKAAEAANVSSVQTGTAASTGNGTVTVFMTPVDPTRSFLIFQTRHNSNRPPGSMMRGRIAANNRLEFVRVTNETSTITIRWYVITFSSGVRVQRGAATQSATIINVPIAAVASLSQAFVTWSKTPAAGDQIWSEDDPIVGELTSTTNLQFRVNNANNAHWIWWQVIEFTDAADITVQKGTTSLAAGASSVNVNLATPVNVNTTFVLASFRAAGSGPEVGRRMLRAQLVNQNLIEVDRYRTGDVITEIVWQAVELRDGSTVQRGSERFNNNDNQEVVTLGAPVDTNRAVAFASVQPAGGQNMGRARYQGDDIIGVGSVTMALSANQITMTRTNDTDRTDIGWFVVEFNQTAGGSVTQTNWQESY